MSAGNFTYVAPPVISGLAPTSGLAAGGTSVVITGTGFSGATAVQFGGTTAASFVVNSDNPNHCRLTRGLRLDDRRRHNPLRFRQFCRNLHLHSAARCYWSRPDIRPCKW